jgi:hypothetical protein
MTTSSKTNKSRKDKKIFTKKDLKKFECPSFAIIYLSHPKYECNPCMTFIFENWSVNLEVDRILEMCGFTEKQGYSHEVKVFDAKTFDWDEINNCMMRKYYGEKRYNVKSWPIFNLL